METSRSKIKNYKVYRSNHSSSRQESYPRTSDFYYIANLTSCKQTIVGLCKIFKIGYI